jgi:DNA-binding XRE family transcriptional regulator
MNYTDALLSYRKRFRHTQAEAADRLGVSLNTVKSWEANSKEAPKLLLLALDRVEQLEAAPEELAPNLRRRVPARLRPKCHLCSSAMYLNGNPTESQWNRRLVQHFGCKKRRARGKSLCASPLSVAYFLDSILVGTPERVPVQREWSRRAGKELSFPRERVQCPASECPRNRPGSPLPKGMPISWGTPRALKGYPEYGKLLKFRCVGTARHAHKPTTIFWSLKLNKVVNITDPSKGSKTLDWWEERRGSRDACPECSRTLQRQQNMKKGLLKGCVQKRCPDPSPHQHGKFFYFDAKTGERKSIGQRTSVDLPAEARICPGCSSRLFGAGRCTRHKNCFRMVCVSRKRLKSHGPITRHWDLAAKRFAIHSRRNSLPPQAKAVAIRNCPRCKKPMSASVYKGAKGVRIRFACYPCRRRFGRSWTISVGLDNRELHRGRARA